MTNEVLDSLHKLFWADHFSLVHNFIRFPFKFLFVVLTYNLALSFLFRRIPKNNLREIIFSLGALPVLLYFNLSSTLFCLFWFILFALLLNIRSLTSPLKTTLSFSFPLPTFWILFVFLYVPSSFALLFAIKDTKSFWLFAVDCYIAFYFFCRVIYISYDLKYKRIPPLSFFSLASYFFSAPNSFGCTPFIAPTLYYSLRDEKTSFNFRVPLKVLSKAFAAYILCFVISELYYNSVRLGFDILLHAPHELSFLTKLTPFYFIYVTYYLWRYAYDQMGISFYQMYSYRVHDNYYAPLLSSTYSQYWRRWNVHFRQFVLTLFFFPTHTFLKRRGLKNEYLRLGLSTFIIFIGHFAFFTLFRSYFLLPHGNSYYAKDLVIRFLIYDSLDFLIIYLSLAIELARPKVLPLNNWIQSYLILPLKVLVVFTLRSVLISYFIYYFNDRFEVTQFIINLFK